MRSRAQHATRCLRAGAKLAAWPGLRRAAARARRPPPRPRTTALRPRPARPRLVPRHFAALPEGDSNLPSPSRLARTQRARAVASPPAPALFLPDVAQPRRQRALSADLWLRCEKRASRFRARAGTTTAPQPFLHMGCAPAGEQFGMRVAQIWSPTWFLFFFVAGAQRYASPPPPARGGPAWREGGPSAAPLPRGASSKGPPSASAARADVGVTRPAGIRPAGGFSEGGAHVGCARARGDRGLCAPSPCASGCLAVASSERLRRTSSSASRVACASSPRGMPSSMSSESAAVA